MAIDADRSLFEALGIGSIPAMVVIDGEGRIVAKGGHTDSVRASHLQALVAGEEVEFPRSKEAPRDRWALEESGRPAPLLVAEIRPATDPSTESTTLSSEDFYEADGLSLTYVAEMAYSGEGLRVVVEGEPPDQRYRISAKSPEGIPSVRRLLRVSLEEVFGVRAQRAEKEMEVFLLEKTDSSGVKLAQAVSVKPGVYGRGGSVTALRASMDWLAKFLEGRLDRPVLDETGLGGFWDIELDWTPGDQESLIAAVEEQLGLELERSSRILPVMVVTIPRQADQVAKEVQHES